MVAWVATVVTKHLKWSAVGRPGHPGIIEFDFGDTWSFVAASIASFWPVLVISVYAFIQIELRGLAEWRPAVGGLILLGLLLGAFIYPMCQLASMLCNTARMAFNYPLIVVSIRRVLGSYVSLVFVLAAISVLELIARSVVDQLPYFTVAPARFALELYTLTLFAHLLGRLYYCNEQRLGWFTTAGPQEENTTGPLAVMAVLTLVLFGGTCIAVRPGPQMQADQAMYAAEAAIAEGDMALAENEAERALELAPESPKAWVTRACVRMGREQYEQALQDLDKALELDEDNAAVWGCRAQCLMQMGRKDEAAEAWKRLYELEKDALEMIDVGPGQGLPEGW
jgi:hypothetical protein